MGKHAAGNGSQIGKLGETRLFLTAEDFCKYWKSFDTALLVALCTEILNSAENRCKRGWVIIPEFSRTP